MKKAFIQIIVLFTAVTSHAQQAFTNSGNLQIHTGASVTGFGNFTNTSAGALTNNGQLHVKGHLINDQASMAIGTGTLLLDGTSTQIVVGAQTYKTYHLNTNNTAGITLNNNLSITGTHTFTNGIITTSATPNYLVYEAGSSYSGDGDARHVNGWVKKIGSTNFIFPVGNGTVERTVALNSLSASSEFNVKYLSTTPNSNSMVTPVRDVDDPEYWTINKISGGTATVTLNWNYSKVYFPNWIVPDILVTGHNGTAWTDNGGAGTASGAAATTGTVTSSSISAFNLFTFGSRTYVLPLTLISFNAVRQNNYTYITWTTEKEYNAVHFIVERSDDGSSFYSITQLPGRNSGVTEQYNTKDNAPIHRIAYYRLRFVDADGHENLSRTVAITVITGNQLTLLTNPVHDKITLSASPSLNGIFNYTVIAMNGQLIQQGKLVIENGGSYQVKLKRNIKPGSYTLNVNNDLESFRYKLSVQ